MCDATRQQKLDTGGRNLRFDSLRNLTLAENKFRGKFPDSMALLTTLEWLDFSKNMLTGPIPAAVAKLKELKYLNLSENRFAGEFPQGTFRTWVVCQSLNLSKNDFKG